MATVRDVIAALERMFPPGLAQDWDSVGLAVGDPDEDVSRALFAVDPTLATAQEAISVGAQLLVTHHPLMLRGVTSVATDTPKGAVVHRLVRGGCALFSAHTNADAAAGGVNEALAAAVGVVGAVPLEPDADDPELGLGRIGNLDEPASLRDFAARVSAAIPRTSGGVRAAGDPQMLIKRVAILGGAGDSLLAAVAATDADAYITADLRHHPALEARELAELRDGRPALIDVSHFASESLWLAEAAEAVGAECGVETVVSQLITDPWTLRVGGDAS